MAEESSTLQDFPLQASIQAVKASADFESYADFRQHLLDHLNATECVYPGTNLRLTYPLSSTQRDDEKVPP